MQSRIDELEGQLNRANAAGRAGHQTLMESLNNFLNARTENVLLADQANSVQQSLMSQLSAKQTVIDALQAQVVTLTANQAPKGVVINATPEPA